MKKALFFLLLTCCITKLQAQVKIGDNPTSISSSAILELETTNKGFLLPRLNIEQREAIESPAKGLIIYNTTTNELQVNTGTPNDPIWTVASVGATGPQGPQGDTGSQGPAGANGVAGTNGTNGATWTSGTNVPDNALGSNGDYYLNTTTSDVYLKTADVYNIVTNIKGDQGPQGETGATGPQGATGPAGSNGVGGVSTAGTNVTITGSGTVASPYIINATAPTITASNGLTASNGEVKLGGTLTGATTVAQGTNNLTFSGTARTIVGGSFQTQGLLYAKPPRVHPVANSITWQADDVIILLVSTHSGNIVFPSASANPNRLIGINNRSGSARSILDTTGSDTGIYANEALGQIANANLAWFISDGISWRLYSGRP